MARQNSLLAIDQDRIGEAELPDAVGDLPDLLARVGAGIAGAKGARKRAAMTRCASRAPSTSNWDLCPGPSTSDRLTSMDRVDPRDWLAKHAGTELSLQTLHQRDGHSVSLRMRSGRSNFPPKAVRSSRVPCWPA